MKMFYVYKKEWSHYVEDRGAIVIADTWQRAKGIVMAQASWSDQNRCNVLVTEINNTNEGIITNANWVNNSKEEVE